MVLQVGLVLQVCIACIAGNPCSACIAGNGGIAVSAGIAGNGGIAGNASNDGNTGTFTDKERTALHLRGLTLSMNIESWLWKNGFNPFSVQVEQEAMSFLLPGYFHGDLVT